MGDEIVKAYKVVWANRGGGPVRLYSVVANGACWVRYRYRTWAKAPFCAAKRGYHLLVFSTLYTAKKFRLANGGEVWRANCRGLIDLPPMCDVDSLPSGHFVTLNSLYVTPRTWPVGTMMFKEVQLVKRLTAQRNA